MGLSQPGASDEAIHDGVFSIRITSPYYFCWSRLGSGLGRLDGKDLRMIGSVGAHVSFHRVQASQCWFQRSNTATFGVFGERMQKNSTECTCMFV